MPTLSNPRGAIEYVRYPAAPNRPTMIFLHEGLGSAGQWGRLPRLVHQATGAGVVAYSRHGYGGSPGPDGPGPAGPRFLHDEALVVLPDVIAALEIDDPILVGHSDGATIAAIYAGAHPARALVLIAPHVFVEDTTLAGIRSTATRFDAEVRGSLALFHDDPELLFDRWSRVWCSAEFAGLDITESLRGITVPTLLIEGAHDRYGTVAHGDRIVAEAPGPVHRRLLPDAGHHPHLDDPDEIGALIADFLEAIDSPLRIEGQ